MQSIHSDSLWVEIERLASASCCRVDAVAYTTDDELIQFGKGDLLVVDASDQAIRAGQTSHSVLQRAFDRGAKLYCYQGLHAKLIVFDDTVVIGSANLSRSSRHNLIEAGIVTDDPSSVAAARFFVEQLAKQSNQIDEAFLERIGKIEVVRHGPVSVRRPEIRTGPTEVSGVDCYVSFSDKSKETEGVHRSWVDARRYGFVSAGGKDKYVKAMNRLSLGDRVFVYIPIYGYVAVGIVMEKACRMSQFLVEVDGKTVPIKEAPLTSEQPFRFENEPEIAERLVRVRWIEDHAKKDALKQDAFDPPLFTNPEVVCNLKNSPKTVEALKEHFGLSE